MKNCQIVCGVSKIHCLRLYFTFVSHQHFTFITWVRRIVLSTVTNILIFLIPTARSTALRETNQLTRWLWADVKSLLTGLEFRRKWGLRFQAGFPLPLCVRLCVCVQTSSSCIWRVSRALCCSNSPLQQSQNSCEDYCSRFSDDPVWDVRALYWRAEVCFCLQGSKFHLLSPQRWYFARLEGGSLWRVDAGAQQ